MLKDGLLPIVEKPMRFACLNTVFNHPRIVAWCHSFVVDDYQRSAERRPVVNNTRAYNNETRETSTAPKMWIGVLIVICDMARPGFSISRDSSLAPSALLLHSCCMLLAD